MECKRIYIKRNIKLNPSEISFRNTKIASPTLNVLFKKKDFQIPMKSRENNITEIRTLAETIKILNPKIQKRCLSSNGNKTKGKTMMKRNTSFGNLNKRKISQCASTSTVSTSYFNDSKLNEEIAKPERAHKKLVSTKDCLNKEFVDVSPMIENIPHRSQKVTKDYEKRIHQENNKLPKKFIQQSDNIFNFEPLEKEKPKKMKD